MTELNQAEQILGLTEMEISRRCAGENLICAPRPGYWTAEIYSFGKYLREYGYFPQWLPLLVYTDHGPSQADSPLTHELESDAPVQFYHSSRMVEKWKKITKKPCYTMFSPFVFYRKTRKIVQNRDAKGTLAYPSHTTPLIDDEVDYEKYIEQLMSLPKEFHPISVQLHVHDVNKGQHKLFMKHKIPVYTAGHYADYRFVERFYETLKQFKYTTSNVVMSCLFYSVEMGIPHFLYGIEPVFNNKGQEGIPLGREFKPLEQWEQMRKVTEMFSGLNTEITDDQRKLVNFELGIEHGASRFQMAGILFFALANVFFRKLKNKMQNGCI